MREIFCRVWNDRDSGVVRKGRDQRSITLEHSNHIVPEARESETQI